jgi:hypothetical protein
MHNGFCEKWGHDYKDIKEFEGSNFLRVLCIDCGSKDFFHKDDNAKQKEIFKRAMIQPYQTKEWHNVWQTRWNERDEEYIKEGAAKRERINGIKEQEHFYKKKAMN